MFNSDEKRSHEIRTARISAFGSVYENITANASDKLVKLHKQLLRVSYIHRIEKVEKGTAIYYFSFDLNQYKTDCFQTIFIANEDMSFEDIEDKIIAVANS
ncbi:MULTISPECIES: hypothetical protein [unclassified Acinetobacter]|uniref:hypothetical protein n=1 Tax=unclassified Acinetobacter TaxID=196816 RepID=UPI0015D339AC|nr:MULTISPECIES: hypothetical protein [unclassified Acinetobacter]UUS62501.1 hypothetical protein MST17_16745 [Acinetobacter sp. YH16056_T]